VRGGDAVEACAWETLPAAPADVQDRPRSLHRGCPSRPNKAARHEPGPSRRSTTLTSKAATGASLREPADLRRFHSPMKIIIQAVSTATAMRKAGHHRPRAGAQDPVAPHQSRKAATRSGSCLLELVSYLRPHSWSAREPGSCHGVRSRPVAVPVIRMLHQSLPAGTPWQGRARTRQCASRRKRDALAVASRCRTP
jgi:hypothetical protein